MVLICMEFSVKYAQLYVKLVKELQIIVPDVQVDFIYKVKYALVNVMKVTNQQFLATVNIVDPPVEMDSVSIQT